MSVRRELASGVFYTSIAKYAGIVVTLVVTGILSRLFTPEEFGVVNIATVVIAFFAIFSDLGIPSGCPPRRIHDPVLSDC